MKVDKFFSEHPVFRYEEFSEYMTLTGINRPESWRQQLNYHRNAGHIIHIRKFLYAVKPAYRHDDWIDPYLIASKALPNAILAYHTALELYGVAYTTFNELSFLSERQSPPFSFEAQQFKTIVQPQALIKTKNTNFGVDHLNRGGLTIKVTSLERTIVDLLDRPDLGGGWEEIWRSFENITQLDVNKVVQYALMLDNATTIAKVGYYLDQRPKHFVKDQSII
jgi:predicted transcriptional regulator of viral defense system